MKKSVLFGLFVFASLTFSTFGQITPTPSSSRVVVTDTLPPIQDSKSSAPTPVREKSPAQPPQPEPSRLDNLNQNVLSFSQIKAKIAEAKRQLQTRPLTTAASESVVFTSLIRVAYYDWDDEQIDSIVMSKDQFLMPLVSTMAISANGKQVTSRTIRGNGVNTPVVITDLKGKPYLPLLVQYPRENGGVYSEMAYYVSTHPGLITPEVVNAGRFYVHNVIEIARDQLRNKGYVIQPKIADIAERLATVEHVDHLRFRTEYHPNIYNDIFTLYALNEGQTYRYSVSSAGAGGMVQMIPSTYRMVRSRFGGAALMPDFVEGMRNHVNAAQAMLLYMQMTWDDLSARQTITDAMQDGIATQEQLMAAGYNSNPAKLAGYINRGGESWTNLIPKETQIYLRIWDSLERAVDQTPRKR